MAGKDHHGEIENPTDADRGRRTALILAEFDTPGACMHAAEKLRDAGYQLFDTHTPFPVHGMDRAMGLKDSKLGWIVLAMALTGLTGALSMMYFMNGYHYPLVVGGKPPGAIPSMIPVAFELTVLFSAFGSLFGMLGMNRLPRHNHPVFESDRFRAASDDKFFVSVEADDPHFDEKDTRALLETAHATHIETIEEEVA